MRPPAVVATLRALIAAALLLACGMAWAQAAPGPVAHFTSAQELEVPGPAAPLQDRVEAQRLAAGWREVALPFTFAREVILNPDAPSVSTRWFRVQVPALDNPGDTASLYVKRWQTAGQIAVYADGRLVHRSVGSPAWHVFRHPGLLVPLSRTPSEPVPREILVRMDSVQGAGGGLSSFYVGSARALLSQYTVREWFEYQVPFMSSAAFLAVGLFCLGVSLWLRGEPLYLLLAGFSLLQVVRRWHFHTGLEALPVSDAWFGWITVNALAWQIVIMHAFLQLLHGRPMPRLTLALVVLTSFFTVLTLPLGALPALLLLRPALQVLQMSLVTIVLVAGLWHSARSRSWDGMLLCATIVLALVAGVYDWVLAQHLLPMEWFYLTPYIPAFHLAALMFIMLRRYVCAIGEVESVNAGLAHRLAAREAELALSYDRLRAVEQRQVLHEERQRLMQDMHDGLGSSLTSAIRSVERGTLTDADVAQLLADCMDDLKLAIDSMEQVEPDLLLLLATLRFRLEPRIESAGLTLRWEVRDIPPLPWLDASTALHVLRILQEAVTNILRHTRATEIHVATGIADGGVEVCIEDNGHGFDVGKARAEGTGRGLRNQLRRAEAVGGRAEWRSGPEGTCFTLWLPLASAVEAAAEAAGEGA
ncbi:sensor histidine kinase [Ramlibacter sp. G-1-2-2]|uniref:histidine kinase n=1 Tax=Ramlibacter agri TaxID=2728837 RepID=A0A848HL71_9BURK|nr:sensor histidine kinase [Ramlibacter agri]NML48468.1 sensor histidine kinase [Ramlibacter agri]